MEKGEMIGRGRTADVFAWGPDRILKLYQPFMPVEVVEREFRLTRLAGDAGLPVAAADALVEVEGRLGIVFERLSGPSMLKFISAQPWKMPELSRQLGELHAWVHRCQASGDLPMQRQQIEQAIRSNPDLPAPAAQAALARLAGLPQGSAICHGDFHPDNVLITPRGPVIIDWLTGCRGEPAGDLGRTLMILQTSGLPEGSPWHLRLLVALSRFVMVSAYRGGYLRANPLPSQKVEAWRLPLLAARLREMGAYPREKELLLRHIQAILEEPN